MQPTRDDQRREVAEKLREVETLEYDGDEWCDEGDVLDALGLYNEDDPSSCNPDKVALLAELIDRPTCQMVECTIDHGSRSWGMRCTACGKEFEHMKPSCGWHCCPNCGAEVVE